MNRAFLKAQGWADAVQAPLAPDASSRVYTRLTDGDRSAVLMEAPVDSDEAKGAFAAFRAIGAHLRTLGLSAPQEFAADPSQGLILMEDLGNERLAQLIETGAPNAAKAYSLAAQGLATIAAARPPAGPATPGPRGLAALVGLTFDHLPGADPLRDTLLQGLEDAIATHAPGPPVLSLRDVHGDNLMWCPAREGIARIGWLDYQDAVILPAGYDLASLLDDPRRIVPADLAADLIAQHSTFERVATLSLARNLRILGIFRRLATQFGKPGYAAFLPRTRALIQLRLEAVPSLRAPVEDLLKRTEAWLP